MEKIGIATCQDKPQLTLGDRALLEQLRKQGVEAVSLIWDQPTSPMDVIIVRSTWDYHKKYQQFRQWISHVDKSGVKLINSAQTILWNIDKAYLLELSAKGIPIVPSLLFKKDVSQSKIIQRVAEKGWSEVVIKPTISATAYLTFRMSPHHPDFSQAIKKISEHSDILVQPFIPSVVKKGEVSLIFFNDYKNYVYSHSVLKRAKEEDFRVQADFGGTDIPFQPAASLIEFAKVCLSKVPGEWIFARVDVIDFDENPLLSEVELIEPDLFLSSAPTAAGQLAQLIFVNTEHGANFP